jgi:hypothetical protein
VQASEKILHVIYCLEYLGYITLHQVPSLSVSMKESGKSRADLWAFATLIAAQMGVEQNNLACQGKTSSKNQFINLKI